MRQMKDTARLTQLQQRAGSEQVQAVQRQEGSFSRCRRHCFQSLREGDGGKVNPVLLEVVFYGL